MSDTKRRTDSVAFLRSSYRAAFASLPGVESAGLGSDIPWTGYDDNTGGSRSKASSLRRTRNSTRAITWRLPAISARWAFRWCAGRFFTDADKPDAPLVLIINHAMAERYWPGEDAVGKRITFEDHPKEKDWITSSASSAM